MAMTVGQGLEEGETEVMAAINTTPLVDVMLVLLIIFLITIPVVVQNVQLELPKEVDSANISAEFENGMLTVRVPKVAKAQPQRIAIAGATKAIGA